MARNDQWVDSDLHRWSERMREVLRSDYPGLADLTRSVGPDALTSTFERVVAMFASDGASAAIMAVLAKLESRAKTQDSDLDGVSACGMLHCLVEEGADPAALRQALLDMGQTCVQGDTHRLFALYVATSRCKAPG